MPEQKRGLVCGWNASQEDLDHLPYFPTLWLSRGELLKERRIARAGRRSLYFIIFILFLFSLARLLACLLADNWQKQGPLKSEWASRVFNNRHQTFSLRVLLCICIKRAAAAIYEWGEKKIRSCVCARLVRRFCCVRPHACVCVCVCFSWRNSKRYLGLQISGAAHAFCLTEGKLNYLWLSA
jgi:hypothetical protein